MTIANELLNLFAVFGVCTAAVMVLTLVGRLLEKLFLWSQERAERDIYFNREYARPPTSAQQVFDRVAAGEMSVERGVEWLERKPWLKRDAP